MNPCAESLHHMDAWLDVWEFYSPSSSEAAELLWAIFRSAVEPGRTVG